MDGNPVLLKSRMFGGFNKKEVLSYIFELNESSQETQQKFAEQIEELSNSCEQLNRSLSEAEARLAAVQADLDDATSRLDAETARNSEAQELIGSLKAEAAKLDKELADKDNEILRFTSKNSELAEKNSQLEEKRGQVELAASQIAKLLGEARESADKVIQEARAEAAGIAAEAKRQADGIVAVAKTSAACYIDDANRSVNDAYKQFTSFRNALGSLQKTIADAASDMNTKLETVNRAADEVGEVLPEALELPETELLSYAVEEPPKPEPVKEAGPETTAEFAKEVLGRYGVRKDDSGFFRLAAERHVK